MIKFYIIIFGFLIFFVIFLLHLLLWRIFKPKNDLVLLLILFIFIPSILFILFIILNKKYLLFFNNFELLLIFLLYISFGLAYTQLYPGLKESSPTLAIINLLGRNKNEVKREVIYAMLCNYNSIDDKIISLQNLRLIKTKKINEEDVLILTQAGNIFANMFIIYRKFLGLKEGKG